MRRKKIISKLSLLGIMLIFIGIAIFLFQFIHSYKVNEIEKTKINNFFEIEEQKNTTNENLDLNDNNETENEITDNDDTKYSMILEIPKLNLKKGLYDKDSKYNNVNYNIQILKESDMPDVTNGNLYLASHNGNTKISYFDKLDELEINDSIFIYYKDKKYIYKIINSYEALKDGTIRIKKDDNFSLIALISCKKKTKDLQLVYIGKLENII